MIMEKKKNYKKKILKRLNGLLVVPTIEIIEVIAREL